MTSVLTVTGIAGTILPGDHITVQVPLRGWARFLVWIRRPWRWPPRMQEKRLTITSQYCEGQYGIRGDDT